MRIIDFNSTKCRHCYKCVRNCEIKAISVLGGRAEIMRPLPGCLPAGGKDDDERARAGKSDDPTR